MKYTTEQIVHPPCKRAGICRTIPTTKIYPTLFEFLQAIEEKIQAEALAESAGKVEIDLASPKAKHKRDRERPTLFYMGCSNILGETIHKSLKRLRVANMGSLGSEF